LPTLICAHRTVQTNPVSLLANSQPVGVGHVTALGSFLIVNNVDRNFEVSVPTAIQLNPIACYTQTAYPDDPESAAFDLDMHALIYSSKWNRLLALNHDGKVRLFDLGTLLTRQNGPDRHFKSNQSEPPSYLDLNPEAQFVWKGDVEHSLLIGRCLVSSSPVGYRSLDPAEPGVFVSEPLNITPDCHNMQLCHQDKLPYAVILAKLGNVSAIVFDYQSQTLAVAAANNICLARIAISQPGALCLGDILWQAEVDFHTTFLTISESGLLVAAGYELGLKEDVHDPGNLKGGGFATINMDSGEILYTQAFAQDLAWGTSGRCLTLSKDWQFLLGVDRYAGLYSWGITNGSGSTLFEGERSMSTKSLGIAHLAWLDNSLFCGFNRGGSRLHVFDFALATRQTERNKCHP
jgi:hypothetical protein